MRLARKAVAATVCVLSGALPLTGLATQAYPSRPIRVVVPLFTGAGTDIVVRERGIKVDS